VRPIRVLKMQDEGETDEKIIAVPTLKLTQHYEHVRASSDLPRIALEQIQHFFEHYKNFDPGKWVKLIGWGDMEEAKQLISDAIQQRERDVPR
jgi:inorganic pyrophosphatase